MNKRRVEMDKDQTRVDALPHIGLNAGDVLHLLCKSPREVNQRR